MPRDIPDVHPRIAEIYRRKVAVLTAALGDPETRLDVSSNTRLLVGKIVLHSGDKHGEVHATLHGPLIGILDVVNDIPPTRRFPSYNIGVLGFLAT